MPSLKSGMKLVVNGEAWKVVTVRQNGKATIRYMGQVQQQFAPPPPQRIQPGDAELRHEQPSV